MCVKYLLRDSFNNAIRLI